MGTTPVNDGEWHHAVGVYDGTRISLYIDGELEADRVFSELMGKDPSARFSFIMERAPQAEAVELDV